MPKRSLLLTGFRCVLKCRLCRISAAPVRYTNNIKPYAGPVLFFKRLMYLKLLAFYGCRLHGAEHERAFAIENIHIRCIVLNGNNADVGGGYAFNLGNGTY